MAAHQSVDAARCDVAIIGAGPYGLAAAAHLRADDGLDVRVFGEPLSFWRGMPSGMLLRSRWSASSIADPDGRSTLDDYERAADRTLSRPLPLEDFLAYGDWFQRRVVPDVDRRRVVRVDPTSAGFRLVLDDGESLSARRVVVAAGIAPFSWRPPQFAGLPAELAFHSSEHSDLARFGGSRVAVVGRGQSALESAALLHESGAEVEVLVRGPELRWIGRAPWLHKLGPVSRMLYSPTDVGFAGLSRLVAVPDLFRRLPRSLQDSLTAAAIRPAGAGWLPSRLGDVSFAFGRSVVAASRARDRVQLTLDDGQVRLVDRVILATGYRVDVSRYAFLGPELTAALRQTGGFPRLGAGFESSVPGLHFLGAPARWSFGPLMSFISGTAFSASRLAGSIGGRAGVRAKRAEELLVASAQLR